MQMQYTLAHTTRKASITGATAHTHRRLPNEIEEVEAEENEICRNHLMVYKLQ